MRVLRSHHFQCHIQSSLSRGCVLGALLLPLPLLAGCGGGGGGGGSTPPPAPVLSVTSTTAHGLTVTLSENTATISVGGSVVYTSTIRNPTAAAVTVMEVNSPTTTPAANLQVRDPSNAIVNLGTAPPPPNLNNFSLASGQSLTVSQTVTAFSTRGIYNATSTFGDDPSGAVAVGPLALTVQ